MNESEHVDLPYNDCPDNAEIPSKSKSQQSGLLHFVSVDKGYNTSKHSHESVMLVKE